jgi:CheY-like chemotaxis protein
MILFVDDEPRYAQRYVEELSRAYAVEYVASTSLAIDLLVGQADEVELLVLDLMMPHETAFDADETRDGIDTGLRLYERLRAHRPSLPVIVLTNVSDENVLRRFDDEPHCWLRRKRDCLPQELLLLVREVLRALKGPQVVM